MVSAFPTQPDSSRAANDEAQQALAETVITPDGPLLFLAIPTYNRAETLKLLLESLAPQLPAHPEVTLFVCDNCSTDETPDIIAACQARGMTIHYHRQERNLGPDANFLTCFRAATGKYFWLLGDDEVLLPGGLQLVLNQLASTEAADELDLLHLSSYAYHKDFLAEFEPDRWGRLHHTFTKAKDITFKVHIFFTFISANIINRRRLMELPHEDPSNFLDTNLIQLSWVLPLLQFHRRSRILYEKAFASRWDASGGYSVGRVFGRNLAWMSKRLLPQRPDIAACITNFAIRRWFPGTLVDLRARDNKHLALEETDAVLRPVFARNFRYWLFTYPAIRFPLPVAKVCVSLGITLNRIIDHVRAPLFWRRVT